MGNKHKNQHKFQASHYEKKMHRGKGHTAGHGGLAWGTQDAREGADQRGNYDACIICLTTAKDPMMCPKGHLYCKGCIYGYLLKAKQDYKLKLEEYEAQEKEKAISKEDQTKNESVKDIVAFKEVEESITSVKSTGTKRKVEDGDAPLAYQKHKTADGKEVLLIDREFVSDFHQGRFEKEKKQETKQYLPSFWVPSLTPDIVQTTLKKPSDEIKDIFGNPLKRKDLVEVKFTPNPDFIKATSKVDEKHMCPVSRKTLTNASKVYLLKPTGDVVGHEAVKIILADGQYGGHKIKKKHVVAFANNGTGFAAGGAKLVKKYTQALLC